MTTEVKKSGKGILLKLLLGILIVIILARIALPYIVLHYANQKLAKLDGHYGHIEDIDIALYRGAYVMKNIYIDKVTPDNERTNFFSCPRIDLSIEWEALLVKKIVGEVEFEKPILTYTLHKNIGKNTGKDSTDFIELVKDFVPLRINRFLVDGGQINYADVGSEPKVKIPLTEVHILGKGLSNEPEEKNPLPASIVMHGALYNGTTNINIHLDPLNKIPTFDMDGTLSRTDLIHLNSFFTAYGNFDLKRGNMSLYTEFAAKENHFKGYVKPIIKDLDIVQFERAEGNPLQITWEAFIGTTAEILQNQRKGNLATKIPIEGKFKQPEVQTLDAILSILKNAFIEALKPSIDHSVNIYTIQETKKKPILGIFRKKEN
ncbi:MAG: DUF748 domain-containing protein [Bacteroidota bacterium]